VPDSIEGRDPPDLSSDEIVDAVLGSGAPKDLIALVGYLGDSDTHRHHRLFAGPTLTHWLDIPDAAIVHRVREPDVHGGRSVLFVKRSTVLRKGEVTSADAEAHYLGGGDAAAVHYGLGEAMTRESDATYRTSLHLSNRSVSSCC
jgi:hypothetical protein